ncbi:hypothetical protein GCM10010251_06050 [Streptomyces aurantiogriseus]|uniref:Uncharacterized protein n=1 Tax=Streptomyces aurantiogriseus TaxID=66870 RepID=A0A918EZI8_9ACTN|nr:hypothetical protein GCM10010251_06050 [Streptomyces aurantiogriseus]
MWVGAVVGDSVDDGVGDGAGGGVGRGVVCCGAGPPSVRPGTATSDTGTAAEDDADADADALGAPLPDAGTPSLPLLRAPEASPSSGTSLTSPVGDTAAPDAPGAAPTAT